MLKHDCAGESTARSLWEGITLLLSTYQTTPRHCVLLSPSRKGEMGAKFN